MLELAEAQMLLSFTNQALVQHYLSLERAVPIKAHLSFDVYEKLK